VLSAASPFLWCENAFGIYLTFEAVKEGGSCGGSGRSWIVGRVETVCADAAGCRTHLTELPELLWGIQATASYSRPCDMSGGEKAA